MAKNQKALYMHCLYVGKPGLVAEFERNLKMIDSVTKFQSVRLADDVDFDARQVEADVKVGAGRGGAKPARGARRVRRARARGRFEAAEDRRGEE